jgi:hypothetical protein
VVVDIASEENGSGEPVILPYDFPYDRVVARGPRRAASTLPEKAIAVLPFTHRILPTDALYSALFPSGRSGHENRDFPGARAPAENRNT